MKQIQLAAKAVGLLLLSFFFQSYSGPSGGDHYKVLLNGKLVTEQFLARPVAMKTLSLSASNKGDQLTVFYSHCGAVGKSRSVSVKDHSGVVLKEWKFADSGTMGLSLSANEIVKATAKHQTVYLFYASRELPSGKQLLSIEVTSKAVAKL